MLSEHYLKVCFLGLGLSIAKSYVEMLGGEIWVESELVLTDESNSINILVAEDDQVSFLLIENILEDAKCKVLHAENGKQTLDIFQSGAKIDIILMDLKMPLMNGFEATKRIRELDKDIPIIAQSAYALVMSILESIGSVSEP